MKRKIHDTIKIEYPSSKINDFIAQIDSELTIRGLNREDVTLDFADYYGAVSPYIGLSYYRDETNTEIKERERRENRLKKYELAELARLQKKYKKGH